MHLSRHLTADKQGSVDAARRILHLLHSRMYVGEPRSDAFMSRVVGTTNFITYAQSSY